MEDTNKVLMEIVNHLERRIDQELDKMQKSLNDGNSKAYVIHQERAGAFLGALRIVREHWQA